MSQCDDVHADSINGDYYSDDDDDGEYQFSSSSTLAKRRCLKAITEEGEDTYILHNVVASSSLATIYLDCFRIILNFLNYGDIVRLWITGSLNIRQYIYIGTSHLAVTPCYKCADVYNRNPKCRCRKPNGLLFMNVKSIIIYSCDSRYDFSRPQPTLPTQSRYRSVVFIWKHEISQFTSLTHLTLGNVYGNTRFSINITSLAIQQLPITLKCLALKDNSSLSSSLSFYHLTNLEELVLHRSSGAISGYKYIQSNLPRSLMRLTIGSIDVNDFLDYVPVDCLVPGGDDISVSEFLLRQKNNNSIDSIISSLPIEHKAFRPQLEKFLSLNDNNGNPFEIFPPNLISLKVDGNFTGRAAILPPTLTYFSVRERLQVRDGLFEFSPPNLNTLVIGYDRSIYRNIPASVTYLHSWSNTVFVRSLLPFPPKLKILRCPLLLLTALQLHKNHGIPPTISFLHLYRLEDLNNYHLRHKFEDMYKSLPNLDSVIHEYGSFDHCTGKYRKDTTFPIPSIAAIVKKLLYPSYLPPSLTRMMVITDLPTLHLPLSTFPKQLKRLYLCTFNDTSSQIHAYSDLFGGTHHSVELDYLRITTIVPILPKALKEMKRLSVRTDYEEIDTSTAAATMNSMCTRFGEEGSVCLSMLQYETKERNCSPTINYFNKYL